jgi:hypothetical protein
MHTSIHLNPNESGRSKSDHSSNPNGPQQQPDREEIAMRFQKILTIAGLLFAIGFAVLPAARSSAQTVDEIVKRGKVKVGVLIGAAPYGSVDSTGNLLGAGKLEANSVRAEAVSQRE